MKLLVPVLACATYAFLYIPVAILVIFSFNNGMGLYGWQGFTLHWYQELFQSTELWQALKNSLIVASASVALSLSMGVAVVLYAAHRSARMLTLFYSPVVIPEIIVAVGLLSFFSFFEVPLGFITLIIGHTLIGLGFVVPIIYSRYLELDTRYIEASLDLGASREQTFIRVTIPFLLPSLVSAGMLAFIVSLDDFFISFFCVGASFQTLSLYIFSMIRIGVSPVINALSTCILVVSSLLVILFSSLSVRSHGNR
jgi:spermidine/putrescine transport system permease protein